MSNKEKNITNDTNEWKTNSGIPVDVSYKPKHIVDLDYARDLADPGQFPFTRGVHSDMYRGQMWTRRSQVGFGTPALTNKRLELLYKEGQTGFTMTIDLPTTYGFDSDDHIARGEVGVTGVPISTLEDMETIFQGLSPDETIASLSIWSPVSAVILAMYIAMAEGKGVPREKIIGTIQNDPFYQLGGCNIETVTRFFPLEGSLRLCYDVVEFCSQEVPKLNYMLANGYNIGDSGVNAVEEAAFSLASTEQIVSELIKRGHHIDNFASRISFFQSCKMDFFEEIAKLRAMRRIWARLIKEKYGAQKERSCWFRTSIQTAGSSLTTQQPLVNIIRATIESLAAVFGGCQSLQPSSYDEGLSLPTEESATMSLRTQQVIGYESGITRTTDPLGGSYYVEWLTNSIEAKILELMDEIEQMGGMWEAIRTGWFEKKVHQARVKNQKDIESGKQTVVGVNKFVSEEVTDIKIHKIQTEEWEKDRRKSISAFKERRNDKLTAEALQNVHEGIQKSDNMIPILIDAVKAGATLGELHGVMRKALNFEIKK